MSEGGRWYAEGEEDAIPLQWPRAPAKKSTPSPATAPSTAEDFEKLGVFYMGRPYDLAAKQAKPGWLLYDSKDLVTHAVCVGMTGSGKTGLCLALLEEAAIDGIPAIIIDPKGDLANLLLTFPDLSSRKTFSPGSMRTMRARRACHPADFAAQQAELGRKAWPAGDRTARAFNGCAMRRTSRSTRRAATPDSGFHSQIVRRAGCRSC